MAQSRIEILPWFHDFRYLAHKDLVRYVKKLPRSVSVLLEASGREMLDARFHSEKAVDEIGLAMVEMVLACDVKGISVKPLESYSLRLRYHIERSRALYEAEPPRAILKNGRSINAVREQSMVATIFGSSHNFKGRILVIVGASHVASLSKLLHKNGIKAKVNYAPFSEKKIIRRYVKETFVRRKFLEKFIASAEKKAELEASTTKLRLLLRQTMRQARHPSVVRNLVEERLKKQQKRIQNRLSRRR